jgi:toxin HigB-1
MAIVNFSNTVTEDINYGRRTKKSIKALPVDLHRKAQIKLAILGAATSLNDLREFRGNMLERLSGDRKGQHSIRINDKYRVCFKWRNKSAADVEITDYH